MQIRDRIKEVRRVRAGEVCTSEEAVLPVGTPPEERVPEIYQVVIECRHEREQRAVFERMRGEGYRCRVLTL